jgi:hypothetical protein
VEGVRLGAGASAENARGGERESARGIRKEGERERRRRESDMWISVWVVGMKKRYK